MDVYSERKHRDESRECLRVVYFGEMGWQRDTTGTRDAPVRYR